MMQKFIFIGQVMRGFQIMVVLILQRNSTG